MTVPDARVSDALGTRTSTWLDPGAVVRTPRMSSCRTASTVDPQPCDSLSPTARAFQLSQVNVAPSFRICA